jgi:hypothetical protein
LNMIYCVFLPISAQVYPAFILYLHLINPPKKGLNQMVKINLWDSVGYQIL